MVLELPTSLLEPALVPPRVPLGSEEVSAHVVIDAVNLPAQRIEMRDHLRPDQSRRTRHENLHDTPASLATGRASPITRAGLPPTIVAVPTSFVTTAPAPTMACEPSVTPLRIKDLAPTKTSSSIRIGALAAPRVAWRRRCSASRG